MSGEERNGQQLSSSAQYIRAAFETSDLLAILVRNSSRRQTLQRIAPAARVAESSFQNWLTFKNESEFCDIYLGMNPLKPGARARTKNDIRVIRHLYIDVDRDAPKALTTIEQSNQLPRPTFVLHTSPNKFQVIWRVVGFGQEQAETLLRGLARKFGGDPAATDSARVLRLPGFVNRKYDDDFVVTCQQLSTDVYQSRDFQLRFDVPAASHKVPRDAGAPKAQLESRAPSQSEHDWAFAKRALLRGEDADDVIRQIARFRAREKPNPEYYARHTVMKAAREIACTPNGDCADNPKPTLP